jgi:hypothetical protein
MEDEKVDWRTLLELGILEFFEKLQQRLPSRLMCRRHGREQGRRLLDRT